MLFVRRAEPEDLEQLGGFDEWHQATEESIRAGECFVVGHDTDVLAYGILNRSFCGRPFVGTIFVHPDHRQTGLGTALLKHFESIADYRQLWISTNIENLGMQRALHKLGFRLAGVINNLGELPELFYFKAMPQ